MRKYVLSLIIKDFSIVFQFFQKKYISLSKFELNKDYEKEQHLGCEIHSFSDLLNVDCMAAMIAE